MPSPIIFVDETAEIGGAERNLLLKVAHLPPEAGPLRVVVPAPGPLTAALAPYPVAIETVPRPPLPSTSLFVGHRLRLPNPLALVVSLLLGWLWGWRLWRLFRQRQPALVYTISMWAHAFGGAAARLAGRPVIWHFQSIVRPNAGWGLYRRLVRLAARVIPNRIICISERVAGQFGDDPALAAKLLVLPNVIDVDRFRPARNGQTEPAPLRIGTVARLTPWKGQAVALQAARQLRDQGIAFQWCFVGEAALGGQAGYSDHLRQLAADWGLDGQVEFTGWVEDMAAFYQTLDVLVHVPTEPEPFGLVLIEALASGLPVVATRGNGVEEQLPQAGGFLVPPHQAGPVAEILAQLAARPDERRRRGQQARRWAEQNVGIAAYIEQLTALFEAVKREY